MTEPHSSKRPQQRQGNRRRLSTGCDIDTDSGPAGGRIVWASRLSAAAFGLLLISLFFNPIPHSTSIKEIGYFSALGLCLAALLLDPGRWSWRTPLTLPMVLYTAWILAGMTVALDPVNSIADIASHWLKYLALFAMLANLAASRERFTVLGWILLVSAGGFSLGGMVYYYGIQGHPVTDRFALGLFSELPTNLIGCVTIFGTAVGVGLTTLARRPAVAALAALITLPVLAAAILTQARGTILALPLAAAVIIGHRRKLLLVFGVLCLAVVLLTPIRQRFMTGEQYEGVLKNIRISINLISLGIIADYPVAGVGFGMQAYGHLLDWDHYNQQLPERYRFTELDKELFKNTIYDPHSMPLSIAVRTGLVGLALFGFMLVNHFRQLWRLAARRHSPFTRTWSRCLMAAGTGFLVIGLFEPIFSHVQETVLFTQLAMTAALERLTPQN